VVVKVVALDVTDDPNDPYPIFCSLDSQSDDDGLFQFERQIEVPYEFSSMTEMPVAVLPVFAFGLPKRGRRKLGIVIAFQAVGGSRVYGHASCSCWHDQKRVGYLELEQHRQEQDRTVAMLAIAVCASDGHMDKAETTVIRRYFSERLANVSDAEKRRQKVTEVLQETATAIQSGSMLPADLIRSLSEKIRKEDDPTLSQVAYELCVQTVAADGKAAEQELRVLDQIAASLSLQPEFVRESHERHLRMSMYAGAADAALVGMPNGLSKEQKIEFLNNEFRKWRSRVTHQDPSVAADASARLERITRMRRELTNA
jgi:tellurite resistance protein